MKTPAFVPLVLFLVMVVVAIAAPPALPPRPGEHGAVGQVIESTLSSKACPKCDSKPCRIDTIEFTALNNPVIGDYLNLLFHFKCTKCGEKFLTRDFSKKP